MALRSSEIYVQSKTKRRLFWMTPTGTTIDEVADRLLNERIEQICPNIIELEREFERKEAELIAKLAPASDIEPQTSHIP